MVELKYFIDDATIVELLGLQNFTKSESAILELVKNAYDAKAMELHLHFIKDSLEVTDDGVGMCAKDIRNNWMHIGKSEKQYKITDRDNNVRVQAGSKGIGRFALSRLGREIELISKKSNEESVVWKTDWKSATLEVGPNDLKNGTKIIINNLREKWTKRRITNLCKYLELTYKDTSMEIFVTFNNVEDRIPLHFTEPKLGINCKSYINFRFVDGVLNTEIKSDEFLEEAQKYCGNIDIQNYSNSIDIYEELKGGFLDELLEEELKEKIFNIGAFEGMLYFNVSSNNVDVEKFLYKYKNVANPFSGGIILYRNAFSISSYEGDKDWLGLGKRSRKSPAMATHPTGTWRVRENQISGYVDIDKKDNSVLADLSNRQGLEENDYYQIFVKIIETAIAEFERYRQKIIRSINVKNSNSEDNETPVIDKVVNKPALIKEFSTQEAKKLAAEIKVIKNDKSELKKNRDEMEIRYKYDVRILNMLATIGLKAASIAHEMKNDKNKADDWYVLVIDALKEYGVWDVINKEENTRYVFQNIPVLLKNVQKITQKISLFMSTMLEQTEKRQFETKMQDILMLTSEVIEKWKRDYAWIDITYKIDDGLEYSISRDVVQVIFDNLVLNSIQQNNNKDHLDIDINISKKNDLLYIIYSDKGKGLDGKYMNNPKKILEVHETTRKDGHGLGMWIVNNTCVMSGGEIQEIKGDNGFYISFALGDKI